MDTETNLTQTQEERQKSPSLEEQVAQLSQKIDSLTLITSKVKRQLSFMVWAGVLKALLIIVPLVVGAILIPPLLAPALEEYGELLGGAPSGSSSGDTIETLRSLISDSQ